MCRLSFHVESQYTLTRIPRHPAVAAWRKRPLCGGWRGGASERRNTRARARLLINLVRPGFILASVRLCECARARAYVCVTLPSVSMPPPRVCMHDGRRTTTGVTVAETVRRFRWPRGRPIPLSGQTPSAGPSKPRIDGTTALGTTARSPVTRASGSAVRARCRNREHDTSDLQIYAGRVVHLDVFAHFRTVRQTQFTIIAYRTENRTRVTETGAVGTCL